jgi:hypothetical protein
MQSHRVEVAVWRAFRWRGTPHYPGLNSKAISASGSSAQHHLPVVTEGAERPFFGLHVFSIRAMNVVSQDTMTDRLYTFNISPEQLRRLGARGGRAYGRNQRARRALFRTPPEAVPPRAAPPATAAESIAVLDARFPWLRGAEKPPRPCDRGPGG